MPNIKPVSDLRNYTGVLFPVSGSYLIVCRTRGCDVGIDRVMYSRRVHLSALFGKKPGDEENA